LVISGKMMSAFPCACCSPPVRVSCSSPWRVHILERIVAVPQRRVILRRASPLFPTRYTRRWARRLREANFGREDACLLSLATFGTGQLKEGRILGVGVFVTCDLALQARYQLVQSAAQKRLQRMTAQLPPPYDRASLPQVQTPREVLA